MFHLMTRDEAPHAEFLNPIMVDFNLPLNPGKIT
ncbi:MAG: hypothetical protein ACQZ3M_05785 [cyanobacterium endosymbiont of Rhopalodia fuxianensis]